MSDLQTLPKHETRGVRRCIREAIKGFVPPIALSTPEVEEAIEETVDKAVQAILQCGWGPLSKEAFHTLHDLKVDTAPDGAGDKQTDGAGDKQT